MFKEMDLSVAVPRGATAITFRYQLRSRGATSPPVAWLANNPQGEDPFLLDEPAGKVTLRFRTTQKLYYRLDEERLHLNLWVLEYDELKKHSC
jgi:hypothetical protein